MGRGLPLRGNRDDTVEMTTPTFRRARRDDVPAIAALLANDPLGAGREDPSDPAPYLAAFDRIDADPRNLLAVAQIDGVVLGCLQMTFIPGLSNKGAEFALIEAVRVDAGLRGQGVGQAFMLWAMDQARARGCTTMELFTHQTRTDAHRFYDRLGFAASHVGTRRVL
jgi:GNAT superfamily N-acetyltransferase